MNIFTLHSTWVLILRQNIPRNYLIMETRKRILSLAPHVSFLLRLVFWYFQCFDSMGESNAQEISCPVSSPFMAESETIHFVMETDRKCWKHFQFLS